MKTQSRCGKSAAKACSDERLSIFAPQGRYFGHVTGTRRHLFDRARNPATWVTRATRSQIDVPIAYRMRASDAWHRGLIVNISRTGALFVADAAAVPAAHDVLVVYLTRPPIPATAVRPPWPDGYARAVVTRLKELTNGQCVIAVRFDAKWSDVPPDVD